MSVSLRKHTDPQPTPKVNLRKPVSLVKQPRR